MKKRFIFTTITLGLVALLGFGFLGAINSQPKEAKAEQITSDFTQLIGSNKTYYAVAKNYANNGADIFYRDNDLTKGRLLDPNDYTPPNADHSFVSYFDITLVNGNISIDTLFLIGSTPQYTSLGNYMGNELDDVYIQGIGNVYSRSSGAFNRSLCAFCFTNMRYYNDNPTNAYISHFFDLFDIYELSDNYYTFNKQINYYAPYGQDIDSYFVSDSSMTSASSYALKTILDNKPFISGGYVFDTIRLRYISALAQSYTQNNVRTIWNAEGFASYMWTEYVNTATNFVQIVNQRIQEPYINGSTSGYDQTKSSKWVSNLYQDLRFFSDINDVQITTLSTLNNSSYGSGNTYITINDDANISGAFNLISMAFASWVPIFSISVLPGISLGMLIFLPLIVGIIILIIWIVKR